MVITVTYIDNKKREFDSIESITNHNDVTYINCMSCQLTSLPEHMNFPNLKKFHCGYNNLTSLPEHINFPLIEIFYCNHNKLRVLPDNFDANFPLLREFTCEYNQLTSLPDNIHFPNLQYFNCGVNKLTALPKHMRFPNLRVFYCCGNKLTLLPEQMNFPNLQEFYCSRNKLTSLPVCIINWSNLKIIGCTDNAIEYTPQIYRFIRRIYSGSVKKINVYSDTQNVHNSNIQCSVRDSINRLTTRLDLPKFDIEILNDIILADDTLTEHVKSRLIEYCQDESVNSLLLLTFAEVLWYVLNTISNDFKECQEIQIEIKRVLIQEMLDAECKCFTGRMNRVVNCLNGFSPLVDIRISDSEQIGNVIVMLKDKALDSAGQYSPDIHKDIVKAALLERGYNSETVSTWLEYIE